MNREQAIALFKIFKTAFPRFYADMTKDEAEATIGLWVDMFKDDDPNLVIMASKELLTTLKFPPTIADVKEKMYSLVNKEEDDMELWNELDKAVRNCLYNTQQVFDGLSPLVKKFVGNPAQLRDLAMSDTTTFNTVTKGQFLKQIPILKQREKELNMMLPENRQLIESLANGFDAKRLLE